MPPKKRGSHGKPRATTIGQSQTVVPPSRPQPSKSVMSSNQRRIVSSDDEGPTPKDLFDMLPSGMMDFGSQTGPEVGSSSQVSLP